MILLKLEGILVCSPDPEIQYTESECLIMYEEQCEIDRETGSEPERK